MAVTFKQAIKTVLLKASERRDDQRLLAFVSLMVGNDPLQTPELTKLYVSLGKVDLELLKCRVNIAHSEQLLKLVEKQYKMVKYFSNQAEKENFLNVLAGNFNVRCAELAGLAHPMMSSLSERVVHPVLYGHEEIGEDESARTFTLKSDVYLQIRLLGPAPAWVARQRREDYERVKESMEVVIREYGQFYLAQVKTALDRNEKLDQLFKRVNQSQHRKEQALQTLQKKQGALLGMLKVLEDAYAANQAARVGELNDYVDWMRMSAAQDPFINECYDLLMRGLIAESDPHDPCCDHESLKQALAAYHIHLSETYDDVLDSVAVLKAADWPDASMKEAFEIGHCYTDLQAEEEVGGAVSPRTIDFVRITTAPCDLFTAVSSHVNLSEATLRWMVAGHLLANKEIFAASCPDGESKFETYVDRMACGDILGGEFELNAIQALLGRPIVILHGNGRLQVPENINRYRCAPVFIGVNGCDYDGLELDDDRNREAILTFLQQPNPSGQIVSNKPRSELAEYEAALAEADIMDDSFVDCGMAYEDGDDLAGINQFFPDLSLDQVDGVHETFVLEEWLFHNLSDAKGSLFTAMSDHLGVDEASLRHAFVGFALRHEESLSIHCPGGEFMFGIYLQAVREGKIGGGEFEINVLQMLTGCPIVLLNHYRDLRMLVPMSRAAMAPAFMQVHDKEYRALLLLGDMPPQVILDHLNSNEPLCGKVIEVDATHLQADRAVSENPNPLTSMVTPSPAELTHDKSSAQQCTLLHISMLCSNPLVLACLLGAKQNYSVLPGYISSPVDASQSIWEALFNVSVDMVRMEFLADVGPGLGFVSQYLGHGADMGMLQRRNEVCDFLLGICDQYKSQGSVGWTHPVALQAYAMLKALPLYFWMADVNDQCRLVPYESGAVVFGMPQLKEPQSAVKRMDFLMTGLGQESFVRLDYRGYATAFPQVDEPVYPVSYRMIGRPVNTPRAILLDVVQDDRWREAWRAAKTRCDATFKIGYSDGLQHHMKIATEQSLNQVLHAVNTDGKTFCEIKGEGGNKAAHYLIQMNLSSAIAHLEGVDVYNDQLVKACKMYDDDGFTLIHRAFQNKRYGLVWRMLSRYMVDAGIPTRLKNGTPGITLMDMVESSLLQPDHSSGDGWVINQASDSYRFYECIREWCKLHRKNHNTYLEQLKNLDKFKGNQEDYERRRALLSAEWDSMRMCRDFAMPTASDPRDSVARHWSPMEVGMEMLVDTRKSYRAQSGFIQRFRLSGIHGIFSRKHYLTRLHQRELAYAHIGMDVVMAQFAQDDNRLVYGLSDWRIQNVENTGRVLLLKECGYALTRTGYSHCVTTVGEAKAGEAQAKEETVQAKEETAQAKEETAVERAARLRLEGELKKLREENKRLQEEMRRRERGEAEPGAAAHEKVSINGDGEGGPSEAQTAEARERYEALERRRGEGVAQSEATNGSHGVMNFGASVSD